MSMWPDIAGTLTYVINNPFIRQDCIVNLAGYMHISLFLKLKILE